MKKLPNLAWTPAWTSILGCIHGALKYLEIAPDLSWLFGATGHAFIINMSKDGSCPSGPTAWNTSELFNLGRNIGFRIEGVFGDKRQPGFKEKQIEAWELTKAAIDQNIPVVGWELAIPEWYLIEGYDDAGYLFNGPGAEMGPSPKPWRKLGKTNIGMLEIFSVNPTQSAKDNSIIKEALTFSVAFNQPKSNWLLPGYLSGQDAYKVWIKAVSSGKAMLMGHAYNAAVWAECRQNATAFLREAKLRLPGIADKAFDAAIQSYGEVAKQLKDITELYPFFENNREEPVGINPKSEKAAEHLQEAQTAEEDGSEYLKDILKSLR
jgi:hypothetical protein